MVAVDQETGKLIWSTQDTVPGGDTILTSAVRVVKGKVIVGSSGAEQAVRGYFSAYDAETGKRVWRFYTVPGDPSKPFEHPELEMAAKTWTGEWWKLVEAAPCGMPWPTIPRQTFLCRHGQRRAMEPERSQPAGGRQPVPGFDHRGEAGHGEHGLVFPGKPGRDVGLHGTQPIILADLNIDGQERKVLMHAPKNGYFYVLDRITGKFISGKPFVKRMTWSMGLDKNGRPIEAPGARYKTEPIRIWPGAGGAHNWAPMSFSPITGLVYFAGNEGSATYVPMPPSEFKFTPGREHGARQGAGPDSGDRVRSDATGNHRPLPGGVGSGEAAGAVAVAVWVRGSGWTNAGDVGRSGVFGQRGLRRRDRREVWEEPLLGERPIGWITYMLDGKQYVSVMARSNPNHRLFTFTLDGGATMPPLPPAAPAQGRGGRGAAPPQ